MAAVAWWLWLLVRDFSAPAVAWRFWQRCDAPGGVWWPAGGIVLCFLGGAALKSGDVAWLVLGFGIVAYEILGTELLSTAYDRYVDRFPILSRLFPLVLTLHVTNLLPRRIDPVHAGSEWLRMAFEGK